MRFDRLKEFYRYLPDRGFLPDDIAKEARTYKSMSDFEPEKGRLSGAVFVGEGEDPIYMKTMKEIFELFSFSDTSFRRYFRHVEKWRPKLYECCVAYFMGVALKVVER